MGRQEELKAKNTPIDGQHYTFVLGEGLSALTLVYAPDGWDDDEFTLQRDMHTFGVFRKFATLELKFVKDGRDYLSAAYEAGGVNTQTKFTVTEYSSMNTTRTRFIGYVDYSTYKITELSVDVAVIDGSFTDLVLSRASTDVNLLSTKSIDGNSITAFSTELINFPEINIVQIANWQGSDYTTIYNSEHYLFVNIINSEYDEAQIVNSTGDKFFLNAAQEYLGMNFNFKIKAKAYGDSIDAEFRFGYKLSSWDGATETIIRSGFIQCIGLETDIDIDITQAFDLIELHSLTFICNIVNIIGIGTVQYSDVFFKLSFVVENILARSITAMLYHEAFDRIIEICTGNAGRFKSDFFGRTDIGYTSDGIIGALSTGWFIRGMFSYNNTLPVSIDKLFSSHQSIYCLGMGIENISGQEKVVIEQMGHFFDTAIVLDVSNRIAPETIEKSYYPELAFNRISVGYNSFDYLSLGGIYEYNTTSKYTTVIRPVDKELNLVSQIRADLSGIINLLKEESTNRDVQGDGDLYILDTIRDGADYLVRTDEGFDQSEDLSNRDTLININISPARNIRRWGSFLRGFLEKYLTSELIWQTSDKNTKLTSTETGQSTITENSDILVSDLDNPLWLPETVTFEVPALETDIEAIDLNMYGLIKYATDEYGWVLSYKAKNENGKCEFTLLRCNTDYVTPTGDPPIYPTTLDVTIVIVNEPSGTRIFRLRIVKDGDEFLNAQLAQQKPFSIAGIPFGEYDIYVYHYSTTHELITVIPVTVTLSADNLHEVVNIEARKIEEVGDFIIEEDGDNIITEDGNMLIIEDLVP